MGGISRERRITIVRPGSNKCEVVFHHHPEKVCWLDGMAAKYDRFMILNLLGEKYMSSKP